MTRRASWIVRGGIALVALMGLAMLVGSIDTSGGDASLRGRQVAGDTPGGETAAGLDDGSGTRAESTVGQAGAPAPDAAGAPDEALPQQELPFGDRIIRTAELSVEVEEGTFDRAWDRAIGIARQFGGTVLTSSRGHGGGPIPLREDDEGAFGSITIRVPSNRFDDATRALRGVGTVRGDTTSSQDVTEEFVDLRSRQRHLRAQEDALLRLMRRARTVSDTLVVQRELATVQAEIERVTGRLNFLEARTEYSTITMQIAEPGALFTIHVEEEEGPSFAKAWDTALVGLTRMGTAGMIAVLWAAPFLALFALVMLARRGRGPAPQA